MIRLILFGLIYFGFNLCLQAQPCKKVKPGMTMKEVRKAVGKPNQTYFLGMNPGENNTSDSLFVWHYGNQQIGFKGNVVTEIIADKKRFYELLEKLTRKEITPEFFQQEVAAANAKACK